MGIFRVENAAALIIIRRTVGEEEGTRELLAALRDDVLRQRDAGMNNWCAPDHCVDFEDGIGAYLSGQPQQGLALIGRAVDNGFFVFPNVAYLQVLRNDPDFAPILAVQQARRKRERDRFLAIVCTDNPYEAVWQPKEGTCKRSLIH
jgi:hypothetical protein